MVERPPTGGLGRRERQIMDIVFRLGKATAAEVQEELEDPPSYSSVRTMLSLLEEKGHLSHYQDGPRYVYQPTLSRDRARSSALSHLVDTFFGGSEEAVVTSLLQDSEGFSEEELNRLQEMIRRAREGEDGG